MLSVYQLKPKFQQLLVPVLNYLHHKHVTANQLTIFALLWSFIVGAFLLLSPQHPIYLLMVAFGLLVRMALNALDGMMARTFNQQSKTGEVLNELGDLMSDAVIFSALFAFPFMNRGILFVFIILSLINEFAGLLAKLVSGTRRYDGPMGKSDRALLLGVCCIAGFIFPVVIPAFSLVFGGAIFLLILSTYKRISNSLK